jgi:hypothetical protein
VVNKKGLSVDGTGIISIRSAGDRKGLRALRIGYSWIPKGQELSTKGTQRTGIFDVG